jgi:hypothetical protein
MMDELAFGGVMDDMRVDGTDWDDEGGGCTAGVRLGCTAGVRLYGTGCSKQENRRRFVEGHFRRRFILSRRAVVCDAVVLPLRDSVERVIALESV